MPHTVQSPPANEGVAVAVVLQLPKENEGAGVILVSSLGADPNEKDGVLAGTAAAVGVPNEKEEVEVEVEVDVEVVKVVFPNEKEGVGVLAVLVFPKEKEGAVGFADGGSSSWHSERSTSSMPMPHTGQSPLPSSTVALESKASGAEKALVVEAAKSNDGVAAGTGVLAGFSKEKEGVAVGVVVEGAGGPNENEGAVVAEGVAVVETLVPALKPRPKEKEEAGVAWAGVTPKEKTGSFVAAGVSFSSPLAMVVRVSKRPIGSLSPPCSAHSLIEKKANSRFRRRSRPTLGLTSCSATDTTLLRIYSRTCPKTSPSRSIKMLPSPLMLSAYRPLK
jgi:hypothetical protein